jgi:hypothetical protein
MHRNAKSLKRNNREREGILIAPSKLPECSSIVEISAPNFLIHRMQQKSASGPRLAARMASRPSDLDLNNIVILVNKLAAP